MQKQIFNITIVCDITSAFSCYVYLFAKFLIFFNKNNFCSIVRRRQGSHHTCCPSTNHYYFTQSSLNLSNTSSNACITACFLTACLSPSNL